MSTEKKRLPPYISYRTFKTFIGRLQQQMPNRIDQSYWRETLSGSSGIQLMAAFRFLGLIDELGKPSNQLRQLAQAKGDQQPTVLGEMAAHSYSFVFKSSHYSKDATYDQLVECFKESFQLTPDVCRKCIKFFVSLAGDAQIPLSPFMTKRFRKASATTKVPEQKSSDKKPRQKINQNLEVPERVEIPELGSSSWHSKLLMKFPEFDPGWNDELKMKWFSAFDELLRRHPGMFSKD